MLAEACVRVDLVAEPVRSVSHIRANTACSAVDLLRGLFGLGERVGPILKEQPVAEGRHSTRPLQCGLQLQEHHQQH